MENEEEDYSDDTVNSNDLAYFNKLMYDVPVSDWNPYLKSHGYGHYKVDEELSQYDTAVLYNERRLKTVTIHSGTNMKERPISDLATDLFITMDLTGVSPRYKRAKGIQEKVLSKYTNYNHTTTGFSLGGAVANQLGHELGIDSHVFNPGVSPMVFKRRVDANGKERLFKRPSTSNAKHKIYLTKGDWISHSGSWGIYGDEDLVFNTAKENTSSMVGKAHGIENWVSDKEKKPSYRVPQAHSSKRKRKPHV